MAILRWRQHIPSRLLNDREGTFRFSRSLLSARNDAARTGHKVDGASYLPFIVHRLIVAATNPTDSEPDVYTAYVCSGFHVPEGIGRRVAMTRRISKREAGKNYRWREASPKCNLRIRTPVHQTNVSDVQCDGPPALSKDSPMEVRVLTISENRLKLLALRQTISG